MSTNTHKEFLFQLVLHIVVLFFYAYHEKESVLELHKIVFFFNYLIATSVTSYYLLPRFFYPKKYWQFGLSFALLIVGVILIEEFVLEKIYFPDTRGTRFPGVYYSLLDVLPIITILCGFKFAWDALNKQREVEALQATIKEGELQFLKSQINPHFLFNNLNNLYSYALEQSPKTPQIILELSSVLRYMLYDCQAEYVHLEKEIEQLEHFTQLSELQIEDRGKVHFSTTNIRPGYRIAPLILIVFIENAFKHSQASQSDAIQIAVNVELSPTGRLDFRCRNSFHVTTNRQHLAKGIGLENVKKRLKLLYPNAHQLTIRIEENLYDVHLSLQLETL